MDDLSELARQLIEEADVEGLLLEIQELSGGPELLAELEALSGGPEQIQRDLRDLRRDLDAAESG